MKSATRRVLISIVTFVTAYVVAVGGLWGLLEGTTYFAGDALKRALGPFWPLFMFGLPVPFAVLIVLYERYILSPEEKTKPVTQKNAIDAEPENLYTALDDFLLDFNHDLAMADQLVGRDQVFAALENFQATNNSGYFRLTAASGLGKSTLAASVARKFNAPSFFCNSSRGISRPDQCLNHLAVTLIKRFSLPYSHLPPRAGEDSSLFETLLQKAAEKSAGPVWVVVDGLDEADEAILGRNTLLLPGHLPEGVFFFITQRPGNYPLRTHADTPLESYEILWDSDSQQDDISKFLEQRVQSPKMSETFAKLGPAFDRKALVSFLERVGEGNFMYLSYLLTDIEAGKLPLSASANALDQISIPRGLRAYYETTWLQMQEQVRAEGRDEWRNIYRPIIGLLAVAREPVTINWLADLSAINVDDLHDRVLSAWQRFLSHEQHDRQDYWRILHRSFADFLNEKLDLAALHNTVANYYHQRDNGENTDGYASRHLSSHLRLAGALEELFKLIDDTVWYERQMIIDPTGMAYENDLLVGWAAASADNLSMVQQQRPVLWLAQEIRYALATTSLNEFWRTIRPSALLALLKAKVLTHEQALVLATNNTNETGRALLLTNLAPVLQADQVAAAIESLETIAGPDRIDPLIAFAQRVDTAQSRILLENALEIANEMRDTDDVKPEKLVSLAQQFFDSQRQQLLDEAVELIRTLDEGEDRAAALIEVAGLLPQVNELAREALDEVRKLDDPEQVAEKLVSLIPLMAQKRCPELIQEVLNAAQKVVDEGSRASLLASLVPIVTDAERTSILERARAAAGSVVDPAQKVTSLLSIVDVAEGSLKDSLLREAEDAAHQIGDDADRALKLVSVAANYFHPLGEDNDTQESTSVARGEEILEEATIIVRGLPDPLTKARVLVKLALELPNDRLPFLVQEAARIPGSILVLGGLQRDDVEQVELVAAIACRVLSPHKEELVQRVRSIADNIERTYDRGHAFTSLLPCLGPESQAELVNELSLMASELNSPAECAELLTTAVAYSTEAQRQPLLERAAEAARSIEPGTLSITGTVNMEIGMVEIDRFPEHLGETSKALLAVARVSSGPQAVALINEAFDFVYDLPAGNYQSSSLKQLAPFLSRDQIKKAIADYRLVRSDPDRRAFLEDVVERLQSISEPGPVPADTSGADYGNEEINLETSNAETDENDSRGRIEFEIEALENPFRLNRSPNQAAFNIQFSEVEWKDIDQEREVRRTIIAETFLQTDFETLEQIRDSARDFNEGWRWRQGLAELFKRLAAIDSVSVALKEAKATWPEQLPPEVVSSLAPQLGTDDSAALLASALETARQMDDPADQAMAFSYLIPQVKEVNRSEARCGMMSALEQSLKRQREPRTFVELVLNLPTLPTATELFPLVQLVFRLSSTRRDLLQELRQVLPLVSGVGPAGTDASIAAAVLDVCNRWK